MKSMRRSLNGFVLWMCGVLMLWDVPRLDAADLRWKAVEEALEQGKPRTALELLPTVRSNALSDRAMGDLARAVAMEAQLHGALQVHPTRARIVSLAGALEGLPEEVQPPLKALLAHWYWDYFRENQYRLLSQTRVKGQEVAAGVGRREGAEQMEGWDLRRLFQEIDGLFQESLRHVEVLHAIPASRWDALLKVSGNAKKADEVRPTLWDVLAHSALEFYRAGEWAGAQPRLRVPFKADRPVYGVIPLFGTMEEFLAGKVERRADESPEERALFLFRDLLRVHARDPEPTALCEVELDRLGWAAELCGVEASAGPQKEALRKLTERWSGHPSVTKVWHQLAQVWHTEGDWVLALESARKGADLYPKSDGAVLCRNLVNQIRATELEIETESQWVSGITNSVSEIVVSHRNLAEVHFRLVSSDFETHASQWSRQDEKFRRGLVRLEPVRAWSQALGRSTNYQARTDRFPVPVGLKPGYYMLLASVGADFSEATGSIYMADVVVTTWGVVGRSRAGRNEVLVVDAVTGEPKVGVDVERWRRTQAGRVARSGGGKTDEMGWYRWDRVDGENQIWLRARGEGNEAVTTLWAGQMAPPMPQRVTQVHLFTDRAIYRPGQKVQYKGIAVDADPVAEKYRVRGDHDVVLGLFDANGQEVERMRHRAGVNGSFAGGVTIPVGRLLGMMELRVLEGGQGQRHFRAEEYKRPKFQVKWEDFKGVVKLGEKVRVSGEAMSYTGAPVDGAEVEWRVQRHVQMPVWWSWKRFVPSQGEAEVVALGQAKTDAQGRFWVEFSASPTEELGAADEPVFRFELVADVTDGTGETRSDTRVLSVGYTTFALQTQVEEWQELGKPVLIRLKAETHNQVGRSVKGVVHVHRVQQPDRVERQRPEAGVVHPFRRGGAGRSATLEKEDRWPLGERVDSMTFETSTNGTAEVRVTLPAGIYRALAESEDEGGMKVRSEHEWVVLDPGSERFPVRKAFHVAAPEWRVDVGGTFRAIWGTGHPTGRCYVEVESEGKVLQRFWTDGGRTQQQVVQLVEETMRGHLVVRWTQVREHVLHQQEKRVEVPEISRQLRVKWERFVSKLEPGNSVDWTLRVEPPLPQAGGPKPELLPTELLAVLYDASLEAFAPQQWTGDLWGWGRYWKAGAGPVWGQYGNQSLPVLLMLGGWPQVPFEAVETSRRDFRDDLKGVGGMMMGRAGRGLNQLRFMAASPEMSALGVPPPAPALGAPVMAKAASLAADAGVVGGAAPPTPGGAGVDEASGRAAVKAAAVSPRRNLVETAFFEPSLQCDSNGVVSIRFKVPDTLTEWRFMGLAHDREARAGLLKDTAVSSKSLMIQPNPPRFLREGDEVEFTAKVSNRSTGVQKGRAQLQWKDAVNGQDNHAGLGMKTAELERPFELGPGESKVVAWRVRVSPNTGPLIYVVTAGTDQFSDGEEGMVPVLSRRVFVTESMPLTLKGVGKQTFEFGALKTGAGKKGVESAGLKVEVVSNPSWYAVMALPYLMEFPHECSEQTFNRYYANALARHLVGTQPRLKGLFDSWKRGDALKSPLEKNEDVKSVILEETPWVREAQDETAGRRKLGELMDGGRVEYELGIAFSKLRDMQSADGRWPWFPGGPGNADLTLYVVGGFGRLKHLGVDVSLELAEKALPALDAWMEDRYQWAQKHRPAEAHLNLQMAQYLYARSFFLQQNPVPDAMRDAWNYWVGQARQHWLKLGAVGGQAQLALAFHRMGDQSHAADMVKSLVERRVVDGEWGVCWVRQGRWDVWGGSSLEIQALVIEMLEEVSGHEGLVEDAKRWLLNQKRGQHWSTTKSTSDAVYALMLRGADWNAVEQEESITMSVGGRTVVGGNKAAKAGEAGTGLVTVRLPGKEVKPAMAKVVVEKKSSVPSWASVHWQYWAPLDQVQAMTNNPLRITKRLFKKRVGTQGAELEEVRGSMKVGDELVVRLEVVAMHDLQYIHVKDQRASGVEPVDVLSGYRWEGGLGYYQSTRDTATHFFIEALPRGTHVMEYSARVQLKGRYLAGLTEIQSMYAPELGAHSAAAELVVE